MNNIELEKKINKYLKFSKIKDHSINGLQIEGNKIINKIITCVTLNLYIINKCINKKINTIICHHGILWKKDKKNILGIKKKKIKKILENNINLFCWHLPLDLDQKIGNNILLAKKINLKIINFSKIEYFPLIGISNEKNIIEYIKKINYKYKFYKSKKKYINKIAICTGKGEEFIENSILFYNIDTYITGEISEYGILLVKEYDINLIIIGHHNSEIFGIKKLGNFIKKKYNIYTKFINKK